jgi:hypothetical protein
VKTKIIGKETTTVKTKIIVVIVLSLFVLGLSASAPGNEVQACDPCVGVGTPGYWMNHPDAWPIQEIEIGGVTYTKAEAIDLMKQPVKGDKWLTMFPATVAAVLNVGLQTCSDCTWCVDQDVPPPLQFPAIEDAQWWLGTYGRPVRAKSDPWQYSHGEAIYEVLDAYNNGRLCAPSRDALE